MLKKIQIVKLSMKKLSKHNKLNFYFHSKSDKKVIKYSFYFAVCINEKPFGIFKEKFIIKL
jgi:hypothetical protein